VPVSGGKDSQVVISLSVKAYGAERVIGVHHYTGIDHPLTYEHMRWMENFYGVPIEFTKNKNFRDMWELLDKKNSIPGRTSRFCTDELKIQAFNQWLDERMPSEYRRMIVLMGMRGAESAQRSSNYGGLSPDDEFSLRDLNPKKVRARHRHVRVRLPIVDKTTSWVFEYLRKAGEKVNPLYAMGHKRVGCYPCILAGKHDYRLAARDPVGRETVIKLRDFRVMVSVIKDIAQDVLISHDLDAILDEHDADPFGFRTLKENNDDQFAGGCQWCEVLQGG
jgi:3'-phosphoadenosine 5'-phosphosulfate sulfotransferase (PAPS reductase)/FAD synthetase